MDFGILASLLGLNLVATFGVLYRQGSALARLDGLERRVGALEKVPA